MNKHSFGFAPEYTIDSDAVLSEVEGETVDSGCSILDYGTSDFVDK